MSKSLELGLLGLSDPQGLMKVDTVDVAVGCKRSKLGM